MAKHDLTGKQFAHYHLVRLLGRGGMADVYLAEDSRLHRQVALKILPPEFARDDERARRFDKEIRATAGLDHPHITTVYEVGEFDGLHYYTMSLLTGGELKQRIASGMSAQDAVRVLGEMANALGYAHAKGFVHRDIKPENILFHEDERSCLTDLGIALVAGSGTRMTATGMSIGTPHYMSPEQCQGEHDLDGRSDLYSLGIVFYEMLTGKVPYDANNTVGIVMKHVQAPIPTLPPALAHYQPILNGLLAKNRNGRFASASELIKAIDVIQSGTQPQSPRTTNTPPNRTTVIPTPSCPGAAQRRPVLGGQPETQQSSRHGIVWALGGAALAAVIAIGAWYYYEPKAVTPGGGATLPVAGTATNTNTAPDRTQVPDQLSSQSTQAASSPLEQQLAQAKNGILVSPNPATARIYVDNAYAGRGTLELTELQGGGSVTIRAEAEGYQVLEQVVRVPTDRVLQLAMDLDKVIPKYAFTIERNPEDARVRILNIESVYQKGMLLEPGKYQVEVSKSGYQVDTRWVEISDHPVLDRFELKPVRHALTIHTMPVDAVVRLMNPALDYKPGMLLEPGRYNVEVSMPGYRAMTEWVTLGDGPLNRSVTLETATYALTIETNPPNAKVRIPGTTYRPGIRLSPGSYGYEVALKGHKTVMGSLLIADRDVVDTVTLEKWNPEIFRDCADCPEMVVIPAGSFMMSSRSSASTVWREDIIKDDGSHHRVTIGKSFALGRYEVTRAEFGQFIYDSGYQTEAEAGDGCYIHKTYWKGLAPKQKKSRNWRNPDFAQGEDHPVTCISWNDARAFIEWLNRKTGQEYRLPSEAEWEYAARAGTTTMYWWGNSIDQNRANCGNCGSRWDNKQTAPVGSFEANPFGLFDVHGNVWEWTKDCWNVSDRDAPTNGSAWESGLCNERVRRGGSRLSWANAVHAASRFSAEPSSRYDDFGFRLARTL